MTLLVLVARLMLVAVFVTSAVAKLRDREGTREAVSAFGVPAALVGSVAAALPAVELLGAVLLVGADPAATSGAVLVLALLLGFTAAIVVNLARGRRPECHCFGQVSAGPTGWSTVARNAALAAVAVTVLAGRGDGLGWLGAQVVSYPPDSIVLGAVVTALVLAVVVLAVVLRAVVVRYGAVLLRLEAVEAALDADPDAPVLAPDFLLPDLDGVAHALSEGWVAGQPALVVFVSPSCTMCGELLPDLARWQAEADPVSVVVVSNGTPAQITEKIADVPGLQVLRQDGVEVMEAYAVAGTPGAVLVGTDGTVIGAPVHGAAEIRTNHDVVVESLRREQDHGHGHDAADGLLQIEPRPVRVGDPVPLSGLTVVDGDLPAADGSGDAVLLFWESTCSYCAALAPELAGVEESAPLLIVSASEVGAVRSAGLRSPVARDTDGAVGAAVQLPGTPTAVLVHDSALAAEVAVGGPSVIMLLQGVSRGAVSAAT